MISSSLPVIIRRSYDRLLKITQLFTHFKVYHLSKSDICGILIIFVTILTRIFGVSIAYNYGIFIEPLERTFPEAKYWELGLKFHFLSKFFLIY